MIRSIILCLLTAAVAYGQTRKEFEVASIRPVAEQPPNQVAVGLHIDGSQVRITYLALKDYIALAYRTRLNQISGPDWLATQRFDIAAKLPDGGSQDDVLEMLQSLLADRFQMKMHREMKEFPVYALEVAKTGLKIVEAGPGENLGAAPLSIAAGGNANGATISFGPGRYFSLGQTGFETKGLTMGIVADMLTRFLDRPVVDRTNLKGTYDLTLNLTPEDRLVMLVRSAVAAGVVLPSQALALLDTGSHDSLLTALAKIGLTLEGRREPLEVIVIDQVQKTPTEN
jgi:uncharacterized protein (TIGR03435 family)